MGQIWANSAFRHRDRMTTINADLNALPTTWEGGIVRYDRRGNPVYVIRRMVNGRRWKKTLDVNSEREARLELLRFDADPEGYCLEVVEDEPIYLDDALVERFLAWSGAPRADNGKANSRKWLRWQKKCLQWWAERLVDGQGRLLDLRRVNRAKHVLPHLDGVPGPKPGTWSIEPTKSKRHKREVIKAIYAWLRKHEGRITAAQDPVMDMPVGKGRVAQTEGGKNKVVPRENVEKVINYLLSKGSRFGHVLAVQAGTGWHTTELVRFIARGELVQPVPKLLQEPGVTAILVGPQHKNGKRHFAKVGDGVALSARILLERDGEEAAEADLDGRGGYHRGTGEVVGSISERHYYEAVKNACTDLGIPKFSPAWMRHTNATHALQQKFGHEEVGKFLGHSDGTMAKEVYGPNAVPPKVPTIMDDPQEAAAAKPVAQVVEMLQAKLARLEAKLSRSNNRKKPKRAAKATPRRSAR